jgi:hypothetical protein
MLFLENPKSRNRNSAEKKWKKGSEKQSESEKNKFAIFPL